MAARADGQQGPTGGSARRGRVSLTLGAMLLRKLLPTTTALLGALAIAAPVAGADVAPGAASGTAAPSADVCNAVQAAGPMAVLGPYGPLGQYGVGGALAGQANPAAACGGPISFALPGQTVGSFVTSNLSLAGIPPATVAPTTVP